MILPGALCPEIMRSFFFFHNLLVVNLVQGYLKVIVQFMIIKNFEFEVVFTILLWFLLA